LAFWRRALGEHGKRRGKGDCEQQSMYEDFGHGMEPRKVMEWRIRRWSHLTLAWAGGVARRALFFGLLFTLPQNYPSIPRRLAGDSTPPVGRYAPEAADRRARDYSSKRLRRASASRQAPRT